MWNTCQWLWTQCWRMMIITHLPLFYAETAHLHILPRCDNQWNGIISTNMEIHVIQFLLTKHPLWKCNFFHHKKKQNTVSESLCYSFKCFCFFLFYLYIYIHTYILSLSKPTINDFMKVNVSVLVLYCERRSQQRFITFFFRIWRFNIELTDSLLYSFVIILKPSDSFILFCSNMISDSVVKQLLPLFKTLASCLKVYCYLHNF